MLVDHKIGFSWQYKTLNIQSCLIVVLKWVLGNIARCADLGLMGPAEHNHWLIDSAEQAADYVKIIAKREN